MEVHFELGTQMLLDLESGKRIRFGSKSNKSLPSVENDLKRLWRSSECYLGVILSGQESCVKAQSASNIKTDIELTLKWNSMSTFGEHLPLLRPKHPIVRSKLANARLPHQGLLVRHPILLPHMSNLKRNIRSRKARAGHLLQLEFSGAGLCIIDKERKEGDEEGEDIRQHDGGWKGEV